MSSLHLSRIIMLTIIATCIVVGVGFALAERARKRRIRDDRLDVLWEERQAKREGRTTMPPPTQADAPLRKGSRL